MKNRYTTLINLECKLSLLLGSAAIRRFGAPNVGNFRGPTTPPVLRKNGDLRHMNGGGGCYRGIVPELFAALLPRAAPLVLATASPPSCIHRECTVFIVCWRLPAKRGGGKHVPFVCVVYCYRIYRCSRSMATLPQGSSQCSPAVRRLN